MGASFHQVALIEHQNFIGGQNGGEAVATTRLVRF